jgi:flagellar basal-body rod protein FlgF
MRSPTYVGLSRLMAQQRAMDVRANNIANANTPGFKRQEVLFADHLVRQRNVDPVRGGQVVHYVQDRATFRDFAPGALTKTDNPLDIAISGDGYFVVDTPRGERFTRAGRFALTPDRRIVDSDGNALLDRTGQPLVIPPTAGQITVRGDGSVTTELGPVGQIRVVRFASDQALRAEGAHLYAADEPPQLVASPALLQGSLEGANVSPVLETTQMMADLRKFQFISQLVEGEGERQRSAIERILRRG